MQRRPLLIDCSGSGVEHLEINIEGIDFILQVSKEKYNQIMEYKKNGVNARVAITNPASQVIEIPVGKFKSMFDEDSEMI